MSLSKPFKLELLPRLALENVLSQMYPIDLCFLMIAAPHLIDMIAIKLAEYCDFECGYQHAEISFKMKNGGTLKICIENESNRYSRDSFKYPDHYRSEFVEMVCDEDNFALEMYKCNCADTVYFLAYVAGDSSLEEGLGVFDIAHVIFPCRFRTLRVRWPADSWISAKVFHWWSINECEHFHLNSVEKDWHIDILNRTKVSRKLSLEFSDRHSYYEELIDLTKMNNYENLSLICIQKMTEQQLLDLNNEHLELQMCSLDEENLRAYLRKWMRGELPKLKTMKGCWWEINDWYYSPVVDTLEDVPFEARENEPCLVKFSSELFIDITPGFEPGRYRTVLFQNLRGDFGTLVTTITSFHFVVWNYPLPSIEVPRGHRLLKYDETPFHVIKPLSPKTFSTDEEVRLDCEGLISFNRFFEEPFFTACFS